MPKYRQWDPQDVSNAVEWVEETGGSVMLASKLFEIPRSTLQGYLSGKSKPGAWSVPPQYLSSEDEDVLDRYIQWMADHG